MLNKVKIINFRSIENMDLYFEKTTNIIWKNWAWKTNILQAICFLFWYNLSSFFWDILKIWEKNLYLEWFLLDENDIEKKITFSFDKEIWKKLITLNSKKITKRFLFENISKISYFSPTQMNLFYLWPKVRRDFLDDILKNVFLGCEKIFSDYEKIIRNRNKVLKNIFLEKSNRSEIDFWNEEMIKSAKKIYEYRMGLVNFIKENIKKYNYIFSNKIKDITFEYKTKVDLENIDKSIKNYLETNFQRDIILQKTQIWPHLDDFDIILDNKNILNFASRWEIKSIIIILKLLEINYIKKITKKTPLLLIDDLTSELDEDHINFVLNELSNLQIVFTSILAINKENINKINI